MDIKNYQISKYMYALFLSLVLAIGIGIFNAEWATVFISLLTLGLIAYSIHLYNKIQFRIPSILLTSLILFVYATLFLGEVGDFYNRIWWWDLMLHAGSAIGFGLVGVTILILLFNHNKVETSPRVIAVFSFTFALAIGALWEIFEFVMDVTFGFNMQKSGQVDTMTDLIIDSIGALIASNAGYFYLTQGRENLLTSIIKDVIEKNPMLAKDR